MREFHFLMILATGAAGGSISYGEGGVVGDLVEVEKWEEFRFQVLVIGIANMYTCTHGPVFFALNCFLTNSKCYIKRIFQ